MDLKLVLASSPSENVADPNNETVVISHKCAPQTTVPYPNRHHDSHVEVQQRFRALEQPTSLEQTRTSFLAAYTPIRPPKRSWSVSRAGRPRKPDTELKRPRRNPRDKPTKLRQNHPVKAGISADAWSHIFSYTDPRTLLDLRLTCRTFYEVLSRESLWKQVRLNILGKTCPAPPQGLLERQYLDLIAGQRCMSCGSMKTVTTQWAFWRRWCQSCLKSKTLKAVDVQIVLQKHPDLLFCIPRGIFTSSRPYVDVAPLANDPFGALDLRHSVFLKKDLTNLLREFGAFQAQIGTTPGTKPVEELETDWMSQRKASTEERMEQARKVEHYLENSSKWEEILRSNLSRSVFYESRAMKLDPPLEANALGIIPAFQAVLRSNREPTDRIWANLLPKILSSRATAEEHVKEVQRLRGADNRCQEYKGMEKTRKLNGFVALLAGAALAELAVEDVADEDFVHLALRRVHEKYYATLSKNRPTAAALDFVKSADGKLRLCMHDALKVYELHILPLLETWSAERRQTAQRLKCPLCKRKDYTTCFTFSRLFLHIQEVHASKFGSDFAEYHRAAVQFTGTRRFPWLALPWHFNLPMLAPHHVREDWRWDPEDREYVRAPPKSPKIPPPPIFHHRVVRRCESTVEEDLVAPVLKAAKLLKSCALPQQFKTLIAWKYATDLLHTISHKAGSPGATCYRPPFSLARDLATSLIHAGEYDILSKVVCKLCTPTDRPFTHKRSFGELVAHYERDHESVHVIRAKKDWSEDMVLLPSEEELALAMAKEGMEVAWAALDELFPKVESDEALQNQDEGSPGCRDHTKKSTNETSKKTPLAESTIALNTEHQEIDSMSETLSDEEWDDSIDDDLDEDEDMQRHIADFAKKCRGGE